eukprot:235679_1
MLTKTQLISDYISHSPVISRFREHSCDFSKYKRFSTQPTDHNASSCDVAIIGGGSMGLNTAYQMARRSDIKIKLFERYPSFGYGSSGHSSAILRSLYSKETMIRFASNGIHQYKHWNTYLNSTQTTGRFIKTGWLLMSQMTKDEATEQQQKLQQLGISANILDKHQMKDRFPQINSDCGVFDNEGNAEWIAKPMDESTYFLMEEDAGCFEPIDALQDLTTALKTSYAETVEIKYGSKVTDVLHSGGKVGGIVVNDTEEIHCACVINCNGPFYNEMIEKLDGLDIQFTLRPVRMQVIYKNAPSVFMDEVLSKYECVDGVPIPIIVDYFGGVYLRPVRQSKQISCGTCKEEEEQDEYDPIVKGLPNGADPDVRDKFLHSLYHRLSPMQELGRSSKVHHISGLYTKSDDVHYLIGNTKLDGFIVCNGFSGHGQKCAPAVGSILAQHVTGIKLDDDTDVDIDFFSPYRQPYLMKSKNVLA